MVIRLFAITMSALALASCGGGGANTMDKPKVSELDSLRKLASAPNAEITDRYDAPTRDNVTTRPLHRIKETEVAAIYCYGGETLTVKAKARGCVKVTLYDVNTRSAMKSWTVSDDMTQNISVDADGIYALKVAPSVDNNDIYVQYSLTGSKDGGNNRPNVAVNMTDGTASDFMAIRIDGLKTRNVFSEPKRVALRANIKSWVSGKPRAVISVPIPSGVDALVYSLRISNNENTVQSDGKFANRVATRYNKVKLMGIPVYEGQRGFDIGKLLADTRPTREEDAFCSMYVLDNASAARTFQDTKKGASSFGYDVNYSQVGTQSCVGEIPCAGKKTVYLGFENDRARYDTFIWLEVTTLTHTTEYLKPEFSI